VIPLLLLLTTAIQRPRPPAPTPPEVRQAMLVAEDSRNPAEAAVAPLVRGLASRDPQVVIQAARGLGRFERGSFLGHLTPLLGDPRPPVRLEAAHALGQTGQDTTAAGAVRVALLAAIVKETDPGVLGALARSLGRLPGPASTEAEDRLLELTGRAGPIGLLLDATRALEAILRPAAPLPTRPAVVDRLRTLAAQRGDPAETAARIRRAAVAALIRIDRGNAGAIGRALGDEDGEVRRLAVVWASDTAAVEGRQQLLTRALGDREAMVRVEALRGWARHFQRTDCGPIVRATREAAPHVGLTAIDLLGAACPAAANAADILWPIVDSLAGSQRGNVGTIASWHRGAHAMVSLARIAPNRVRGVLSRAGNDLAWQVRMYAARAAGVIGDPDRLRDALEDRDDNVREAAIAGLVRVRGHGADSVLVVQLGRPDYQLVQTAAGALAGTPNKARVTAGLLAALRRITAERKETSRDPRMAILERLSEVGDAGQASELEPYLSDFDPVVAARAAALLSRWTGQVRQATPKPLSPAPLSWAAIQRLKGARLKFTMSQASGGGSFEVAVDPEVAPATVARIVGNARNKYYDGLTFHRAVPNFVIQGGSPGANEYAGDALYMRDEIGPRSHERGTLGISTRGRDTGDAQIFVNLVDNLRLDFNYTVWGRVVAGMEVVDGILEGDVIETVQVVGNRE
jgi:cyclophilin family peptidyl-prolyl cis-trans isomerase/HEAT repeat protein